MKKYPLILALLLFWISNILPAPALSAQAQGEGNPLYLPFIHMNYKGGIGAIAGVVTDSSNGLPIQGAKVCYRSTVCDETGEDGRYLLSDLRDGWASVTASKAGYNPITENVAVRADHTLTRNYSLTENLLGEDVVMQVVLTWDPATHWQLPGNDPVENDLDAHLWVQGLSTAHIGYVDGVFDLGNCTSAYQSFFPNACLLVDQRRGSGPETIYITRLENADYYFGVLNYNQGQPGVPAITNTAAKVRMYDENGLREEISPPGKGEGDFWYIFSMDGRTETMTIHNCITYYDRFNEQDQPPSCP